MDPAHPVERLRALSESVGARLLLCSRPHASKLADVSDTVLPVDGDTTADSTLDKAEGGIASLPTVSCTNAAYVIFTSGSTGKPKVGRYAHPKRHETPGF
jgi:non-ribosomal peptide synthetase component F